MPDQTDPAFELARCAEQSALRVWLHWDESRQMLHARKSYLVERPAI
ncbi:hypothetical protein [Cupriavidus sp. a3]